MSLRGFVGDLFDRRPGQKVSFVVAFVSLLLYIQLAYFTDRTETSILLWSYSILFALHFLLVKSILSFRFLIGFGIIFRITFLFSIPALSDDFYRFFWDGVLIHNQINPFLYLPREIIDNPAINIAALHSSLFELLNSPDYYSVYPPVCQFIFWISVILGNENIMNSVIIMKVLIILAEVGSIAMILKLLKIYKRKKEYIYFYLFNPLLIIELSGNIHFEAFMIFFVLLAVVLLHQQKLLLAALSFSLAISAKLTPIIMLPFFLKRLKLKKALVFYTLTAMATAVTFVPFAGSALVDGLSSSLSLYFNKFEFNASIFYIIREIGFWLKGWDIIQVASKWLAMITISLILVLTYYENHSKQNLPGIFIWPLFIYLAFASIIHPWYITPIVAFCLFSKYRFPLVWSFTIFLSYAGYQVNGFQEQWWVLIVEYALVYGVMIYELLKYKDLIELKGSYLDFLGTSEYSGAIRAEE